MEEVSESREIIRQIKNDMKLLMQGKKDRYVHGCPARRSGMGRSVVRIFWSEDFVQIFGTGFLVSHVLRHELRKEGSMQILQLKCLNEKCQLKVKDESEKTENAKNQLNNKRQSHQERFNSS